MTSIMDIGDHDDIHPKFKMEVGRRLALLARDHVYGEQILCDPPKPVRAWRAGNEIRVCFDHAQGGLILGRDPAGCVKAEQLGKLIPAEGVRKEDDALVFEFARLPEGHVTLLFAEEDYCEVQIWNEAGLPVRPFTLTVEQDQETEAL